MDSVSLELDNKDLAQDYAAVNKKYQFKFGQGLVEHLGISEGDACLDVGCGTGEIAMVMAERVGENGMVIGTDPLPERIKIANQNLDAVNLQREQDGKPKLNGKFLVGGAEDVSRMFSNNTFTIIIMNSVLHWVKDQEGALIQIRAALQKNGRVGIRNSSGGHDNLQTIRQRILSSPPYDVYPGPALANFPTKEKVESLLDSAGFTQKTVQLINNSVQFESFEDFSKAFEASSFGNQRSLDHLPEEMREEAQKEIDRQYRALDKGSGITIPLVQIMAVGTNV